MRVIILLIAFCMFSQFSFAQDDYRIGVIAGTGFNKKDIKIYDDGVNKFKTKSFGIQYQDRFYDWGYFTYSLRYSKLKIEIGEFGLGENKVLGTPYDQSVFSIGLGMKPFFYEEYVFMSMDLLFDFTTATIKDRDYANHNGLGVSAGIGSDIPIGKLVLTLNPGIRARSIFDFYDKCGNCGDSHGPPMQFEIFAEVGLAYSIF